MVGIMRNDKLIGTGGLSNNRSRRHFFKRSKSTDWYDNGKKSLWSRKKKKQTIFSLENWHF